MTHGAENGAIFAADGEHYFTHDVWNIFNDTLPEVPKIFIFQACRGGLNEIDKREEVSTLDRHPINITNSIRNSDTVLLFSTLEGARSNRLKSGTCFITELVNAINTLFKPNKHVSLYELMYYVSSNISKAPIKDANSGELSIQTPCTQSFLDKQIIIGTLPSAVSDTPKYRLDNPFAHILLYPEDVHVDISKCYKNVFKRFWCSTTEVVISDDMPIGIELALHESLRVLEDKSALVLTLIGKTVFASSSNAKSYIEIGMQRLTFASLWYILSIKMSENFSNKPKIVLVLDPFELAKSDNVSADHVYHDVTKTAKPIINIQHKDTLIYFLNDKHAMKCLENEILCASEEDICTVILKSMKNANNSEVYPSIVSTLTAKFKLIYQTTTLFDAIKNKDTFLVKTLLMEVSTLDNYDSNANTAIMLETAISINVWDIADLLLLRNATINTCDLKQAYKSFTDNFGEVNQKVKSNKLEEYLRNDKLSNVLTLIFHDNRHDINGKAYNKILKYLTERNLHHFFKYAFEKMMDRNINLINSLLRLAIEKSSLPIIQTLIQNGADVNSRITKDFKTDPQNATGLHIAVQNRNIDTIEYLLQNKANINAKANGNTPLHLAVLDNNEEIATALLKYHADPNIKNDKKKSPFVMAIQTKSLPLIKILLSETKYLKPDFKIFQTIFSNGTLDILKCFLSSNKIDVNMSNTFYKFNIPFPLQSSTPLLYAISTKAPIEYIEYLLKQGATTSAINEYGNTALISAVVSEFPSDVVETLIKMDKSIINETNFDGETVLYKALLSYDLTFIRSLIDVYNADINIRPRNGRSVIHQAVKRHDKYLLKFLLEKRPKVDIHDQDRNSPLHEAIQQSCGINIVKLLVYYNRNLIHMRNNKHETPLTLVSNIISSNYDQELLEIFNFLVNEGSNTNENANDITTVFQQIVSTDHVTLDCITALMKEGTEVDTVNSTKLMHSLFPFRQWNNIEGKLKYLVENNADVNVKDEKGMTVLHKAVCAQCIEAICYLISVCPENVNTVDTQLNTPLHTALYLSKPEYFAQNIKIISILVENGADLNSLGQNNMSPVQIAWDKRLNEVVAYLIKNGAVVDKKTVEDAILDIQNTKLLDNFKHLVNGISKEHIKEHALAFALERSLIDIINYLLQELGTDLKMEMCNSLFKKGEISDSFKVADLLIRTNKVNDKLMTGSTVLHEAIEFGNFGGNMSLVKRLIENGANVNATNNEQKSCLHVAILQMSPLYRIVTYLIDNGACINAPDANGYTPLHAAASVRKVITFEKLIENNANIDAKTNDGHSILHTLMWDYFTPTPYVARRDEEGKIINFAESREKRPNLYKRIKVFNIMRILAKKKSNFNDICNDGTSVLQMAVEKTQSIDIVKELISVYGANYKTCSNNGKTVLMSAIESRENDIVQYFAVRDLKAPGNCLISVISWGNFKTIKCLVKAGADINSTNEYNETPLHLATRRKVCTAIMIHLIESGADINAVDNDGQNILHKALKYRHHLKVIDYLLNESKLNVNTRDKEGNNALHVVLKHWRNDLLDIVQRLVNKGVDIYAKNNLGETPMSLAEKILCKKDIELLKNHILLNN